MAAFEDFENSDLSLNKKKNSSVSRKSRPFKPACWATSPAHIPFLNPNTHLSSLRYTTPFEFPPPVSAPEGLPLRVQPQLPAFRSLDKNPSTSKTLGDGKSDAQDQSHCLVIGNPYDRKHDLIQGETRNATAFKQLEAHINERESYVHLASSRLQAATRIRNTLPFNLPQPNIPKLWPSLKNTHLASSGMDVSSNFKAKTMLKARSRSGSRLTPKSTKNPMRMYTVDPETGKGLKEFLLAKGRELGQKMRECKSISIHDFSPDMRTLAYHNVLLAHYDVERWQRVCAYEVDLPTVTINEETGETNNGSETWLWILIQRPIVSMDRNDTNTEVSPTDHPSTKLPANFPSPVPDSWIVFAAPLAHVTAYRERIEKIPSGEGAIGMWGGKSMKVQKRVDYDFSHDGVPLFEFSSSALFSSRETEFLSVENMVEFDKEDGFESYSEEEYGEIYDKWVAAGGSEKDGVGKIPCPNKGEWWKEFYRRVGEDAEKWKKVKSAMERGKCRVVLRCAQFELDGDNRGQVREDFIPHGQIRQDSGDGSEDDGSMKRRKSSARGASHESGTVHDGRQAMRTLRQHRTSRAPKRKLETDG